MMLKIEKALTVRSPWTQAITHGTKRIENRGWQPRKLDLPAWIALHEGMAHDGDAVTCLAEVGLYEFDPDLRHPGYVVALIRIDEIVTESDSPWFDGDCCGWVIGEVIVLSDPIRVRGAQSLWNLPEDVKQAIHWQLSKT